jgi:NAD kinase
MLVPICPHSLSFRSLLLPSDVNIKLKLSQDSRCKTASVSGDGRNSYEIQMNDILTITSSQYDAQSNLYF